LGQEIVAAHRRVDLERAVAELSLGVRLRVALDVLEGKQHPHLIHVTPVAYDNTTPEGMQWLKTYYDPKVDPAYPVYSPLAPFTHYTVEQEKACKGPGE